MSVTRKSSTSTSPNPPKPSDETIKRTKEYWMMAYPMTAAEAQKLVSSPPREIPWNEDPFHDGPP